MGQVKLREWVRVNRSNPCPICKKADWCTRTLDGDLACCMRTESERPSRNGGWLHRLTEAPVKTLPPVRAIARPARDMQRYHDALMLKDARPVDGLAAALGVTQDALFSLGTVWDAAASAWAFPMRSGAGRVCGIRLRSEDGAKWAVTGSKEGLFYCPVLPDRIDEIVLCEGPTDTAAALSLGLLAVGRPSCSGAVEAILELLRRFHVRRLTIIPDTDTPHERPDGSVWYPGRDGAQRLAAVLPSPYLMAVPPAKDLRGWVQEGATRTDFDELTRNARWKGLNNGR
jgi:hypothetical protein